jgi:hypothetical protein
MLAQVSNPTIFPKSDPPKWHEASGFANGIVLWVALAGLGCAMTSKVVLAHIFFFLAWPCGSWSLWIMCQGVFPKRKRLAWVLTTILLGIITAGIDYYATH